MMIRNTVCLLMIVFGILISASAQTDTSDYLTITTYYPSPYGVYGTLKLQPKPRATTCREGEMTYSDGSIVLAPKGLYFCNDSNAWQSIGAGGGGEGYWFYNQTSNALTLSNASWGVTIGTDVDIGFSDGSSLFVNSQNSQGNINIAGASDGGRTWSSLYLHDSTADMTNSWFMGFKKEIGSLLGLENDLVIGQRVSPGNIFYAIRIDNATGRVAIGDIDPTARLDVSGSIRANGNVTATNNMYAQAFFYSSDASLKRDIHRLDGPLDEISRLEGVSFRWRDSGRQDIGLIAQDVEKVFPELVATDRQTGLKSVEYGNLVAVLVEAVKELEDQVKTLKREIEILKKD